MTKAARESVVFFLSVIPTIAAIANSIGRLSITTPPDVSKKQRTDYSLPIPKGQSSSQHLLVMQPVA